jgi:hypothetical protein
MVLRDVTPWSLKGRYGVSDEPAVSTISNEGIKFFRKLLYPQYGCGRFLRNVITYLPIYIVPHPRRRKLNFNRREDLKYRMQLLIILGTYYWEEGHTHWACCWRRYKSIRKFRKNKITLIKYLEL